MKKLLVVGALAAAAVAVPLALASPASASVDRVTGADCAVIPVHGTVTTETFTATQPAGQFGQFDNVWTHNYTIKVQPSGKFAGTGTETGADQNGSRTWSETVTGTLNDDGTISLQADRADGTQWSLSNAKTDGTVNPGVLTGDPSYDLEFKVTAPVPTGMTEDTITGYRDPINHGEYVSFMGGGKAAAQSSCGMPVSAQNTK
jgi:hypothetical protein